ncbi:hypothetical protein SADUNF_Sadunf04G0088300 [Salix dunnii]|uniref:Integrase catalytic domain-containing protein n=1 Tax=Salix dunnii TaxID=1413687 RepID=A0A835N0Q9_9ROSI|nr:hypothetical protein SADUNF_Sadunf04G0088300 [Salix dunnii]
MPKSIVSNRDPMFVSHLWQEFFKMSGTKSQLSSAYHPQIDGQTKAMSRYVLYTNGHENGDSTYLGQNTSTIQCTTYQPDLTHSINQMKQIAYQKRRNVSYEIGYLVLLKLHPYR